MSMNQKKYSLGVYEKAMPNTLSLKEKLQCAKEIGYDFLELSVDETDEKLDRLDMTQEERREVLDAMADVGVPIRSMCLSGHRKYPLGSSETEIAEKSLEVMQKAITLAADLGIRIIQIAGYDVYYESSDFETKKRFHANLRASVEMAEKAGVILGFETMETDFMNTVEKAMKYVTLINSPYLQVYPDLGNLTNASLTYQTDLYEDLYLGKGHLAAMHIKETVPGKFRDIPFCTGHVDFEKGINTAWNLGVRRFVTEFWFAGNADWKEDMRFAYHTFSSLLDKQN